MMMVGLITCYLSGAELIPCPWTTVTVNVTTAADIRNLSDVLSCIGEGDFNITWYSSLNIAEPVVVSNEKNVTVTGVFFPRIRGGLVENNGDRAVVEAGNGNGLFSVSNRSTLRLNNLVLAGGNAEHGGAISLYSSSSLDLFGCTFVDNNATNGGETTCLRCNLTRYSQLSPAKIFTVKPRVP